MNKFLEHLYNNIYLPNIDDLNKCVVLRHLSIPPEQTTGGDRTSNIHDIIMKPHKTPIMKTHKTPMKTHESPMKTRESPMKTHESPMKSPMKTPMKSPMKTHESPIIIPEISIPNFDEDKEEEDTTIYNMQRYILDKKKKWGYITRTYSIEEINNSYINLYTYINNNELSFKK
jgi:hypothetical protein